LHILRVLMLRQLGPVPAALDARLAALPIPALEQLSEALLDMHTPSDLEAWLAKQS
jgi:hypothetical protein